MKMKNILISTLLIIGLPVIAQIKIAENGKVGINGEAANDDLTVYGNTLAKGSLKTESTFNAMGKLNVSSSWTNVLNDLYARSTLRAFRDIIAYDNIHCNDNVYSGGVMYVKKIKSNYGGPGAYGGEVQFNTGSYSFPYTLKITGGSEGRALDLTGDLSVNGVVKISSDRRLKKNIEPLSGTSILDRIAKVEARSYQFKSEKELLKMQRKGKINFTTDTIDLGLKAKELMDYRMANDTLFCAKMQKCSALKRDTILNKRFVKQAKKQYNIVEMLKDGRAVVADIPNRDTSLVSYGFIAQELKKTFPELVGMDSITGLYAVNYIEFVPLLVQAVQDLKGEVDRLEKEINTSIAHKPVGALLYQAPTANLKEGALIRFSIPKSTKNAKIYLYDMVGRQLKAFTVSPQGKGVVSISSRYLYAGIFTYALEVDEQLVDSKQLLVK